MNVLFSRRDFAFWAGCLVAVAAWWWAPLWEQYFRTACAALCLLLLLVSARGGHPGRVGLATGLRSVVIVSVVLFFMPYLRNECQAAWDAFLNGYADHVIDGREAVKIWLLSNGRTIYPDMQGYPFLVTLYTPLYHSLAAILATGVFAGNVIDAGHILAYGAYLCLVVVMMLIIRREAGNGWPMLLVPAAMLVSPYLSRYQLQIRPDLLAWCFAFAAIFVFIKEYNVPFVRTWPFASAFLMVAAIFTKQQSFAVLGGLLTACLIRRSALGLCLRYAVLAGGAGIAGAAVLFWLTDGTFFLHTLWYPAKLAADASVTNLGNAWPRIVDFLKNYWGLFGLFCLAVADDMCRRRLHLLNWLAIVHAPFLVKLVSTWGASNNYFIGFIIILTLRVGIFLQDLLRKGPAGAALALLGLLALLPGRAAETGRPFATSRQDYAERALVQQASGQAATLVNAEGAAPLLASDANNLFFFDATETQYFEVVGLWKFADSLLARDIASRKFSSIIFSTSFLDSQIARAVQAAYHVKSVFPHYTVYAPKQGEMFFLSGPAVLHGNGTVQSVRSVNLQSEQGFGALFASVCPGGGWGETILEVTVPFMAKRAGVTLYPKVPRPGPDDFVEAAWSTDGTTFRPFLLYRGSGKDTATGLFEPQLEEGFAPEAKTVFIRLRLSGSAQLWTGESTPMVIRMEP